MKRGNKIKGRREYEWFSRKTVAVLRDIIREQPVLLTRLAGRYDNGKTTVTVRRIRVLQQFGFNIRILRLNRIARRSKIVKQKYISLVFLK